MIAGDTSSRLVWLQVWCDIKRIWYSCIPIYVITLRPRQNGGHFPDDIFKLIFLNEIILIWIKISLKFVPRGRINNIPALVHIIAWCRPGGKPLSEPMMVSSLTHICVTRPQWVNYMLWMNELCMFHFMYLCIEYRFYLYRTIALKQLMQNITGTEMKWRLSYSMHSKTNEWTKFPSNVWTLPFMWGKIISSQYLYILNYTPVLPRTRK